MTRALRAPVARSRPQHPRHRLNSGGIIKIIALLTGASGEHNVGLSALLQHWSNNHRDWQASDGVSQSPQGLSNTICEPPGWAHLQGKRLDAGGKMAYFDERAVAPRACTNRADRKDQG